MHFLELQIQTYISIHIHMYIVIKNFEIPKKFYCSRVLVSFKTECLQFTT